MTDRIGSRVRRLLALASRLETEVDKAALGSRPEIKIALRAEFGRIRQAVLEGKPLPRLMDTGFRVYSQNDEDGILLFLLAVCGIDTRRFVDIGAGNCLTASNCANLALNLGFHGLFIEGDARRLHEGRRTYSRHPDSAQYPPAMVEAFVTRENVDTLILDAGFSGAIDVLSIDIDGNDYWIWEAISVVSPSIVVIETHTEHGEPHVLAPYDPSYDWRKAPPGAPIGASPAAGVEIAERLGYRLVGGIRYGYNAFFLREGVADELVPTAPSVELLQHPWTRDPGAWTGRPPA